MTTKRADKRKKPTLRERARDYSLAKLTPDMADAMEISFSARVTIRRIVEQACVTFNALGKREGAASAKVSAFMDKLRKPGESNADAARRFNEAEGKPARP